MNNESRTLWISLIAGLFAAFLLYSYSQEKKAEYDKQYGATESVMIARVDIPELRTVDDTMLEIVQRPHDFIEPSALANPDVAIGQVSAVPIKKGEQILSTKLLHPGPDTGIALQVAPEKRAITIPIDDIRGVAKLIRPGDRVDLYAALEIGKGLSSRREVSVLMSDVPILATGLNIMNSIPRVFEMDANGKDMTQINLATDTKYTTVTIEATPKEAQDLIYLMSATPGNIFLTLRNPNDRKPPPRMPSSGAESVQSRVGIQPEPANAGGFPQQQIRQVPGQVPNTNGR